MKLVKYSAACRALAIYDRFQSVDLASGRPPNDTSKRASNDIGKEGTERASNRASNAHQTRTTEEGKKERKKQQTTTVAAPPVVLTEAKNGNGKRPSETDAAEIRIRAERRLGQMMRDAPKAEGARTPGTKRGATRVQNRPASLSSQGIDKHLAERARTLASLPDVTSRDLILQVLIQENLP